MLIDVIIPYFLRISWASRYTDVCASFVNDEFTVTFIIAAA